MKYFLASFFLLMSLTFSMACSSPNGLVEDIDSPTEPSQPSEPDDPEEITYSHPLLFVTGNDKDAIKEKISSKPWASDAYQKIKKLVESDVATHISSPDKIFSGLTTIPSDNTNSESASSTGAAAHSKVLEKAAFAAIVYYVEKNEKYAQFSADILQYYFDALSLRTPTTTTICGNQFYDSRIGYNHLAVAYDFIYPFLMKKDVTVYSKQSNSKIAYDNAKAQKVIVNIAKSAIKYGSTDNKYGKDISNHAVLTSPGALFPILCIEDEATKKELFDIFWEKGTSVQNSFTKTILPMFGEQGIWPEAVSYSFMPNISMILNIVDRLYPEKAIISSYTNILDGNFLFENLRIPNGKFVRYGDSHRNNDATENLYIITNNIAERTKNSELIAKSEAALSNYYANNGGLNSNIAISTYDNYYPYLQLLWGKHDHSIEVNNSVMKPTVLIKHAGVALQRNYVADDNTNYGLCGIIGGAYYVHNHLTGITMELYGGGDVMCANGGLPPTLAERNIDLHTKYFSRYAGNNSVVVNGSALGSDKKAWKTNGNSWQNTVNTIACEPAHLQEPVNKKFSFTTGLFDDSNNNCKQERTLGIVRLDDKNAYYVDIFRSKSNGVNNYHDYIYHNIGDKTNVMDINDNAFSLNSTDIYTGDLGDSFKTPGWYFFESAQTTGEINKTVKVRFDLDATNRYMFMFMPAQTERQYTAALAPATREALNGYVNKKSQVMVVRQKGEAWNRPFISILEPSLSSQSAVKDVANIISNGKSVGVKVTSQIGTRSYVNYIFCNENDNDIYDDSTTEIYFKGRYGIVQVETTNNAVTSVELYIGSGETIKYKDKTLNASDKKGTKRF